MGKIRAVCVASHSNYFLIGSNNILVMFEWIVNYIIVLFGNDRQNLAAKFIDKLLTYLCDL